MSHATNVSNRDDRGRLVAAERAGLRIGVLCRSIAILVFFAWVMAFSQSNTARLFGGTTLAAFAAVGFAFYLIIGSHLERRWMKYALYAVDYVAIAGLVAFAPLSFGGDVPQIIAFRAYGAYYLLLPIALATLSLNPALVVWAGVVGSISWWGAFLVVIRDMDRHVTWFDMPPGADRDTYLGVFLDPDFIGVGNRVEETALITVSAIVMAIGVHRARRVFFAQLAAEAERDTERATRERVADTLGRYVPDAIARRLVDDATALAPQVRHAAVLVMDVRDFTAFSAQRPPDQVITALNTFLAGCADVVSAHDGVVITFTGDGFLATFNTPLEIDAPEQAALDTARALHAEAAAAGFQIRVGIAAGPIAAGSVGSAKRQAFTVYGDTVNRAARLEALAKTLGESTLVDDATAGAVADPAALRPAGDHQPKGLAAPVTVWAV